MEAKQLEDIVRKVVREEIVYAVNEYLEAEKKARLKAKIRYDDFKRARNESQITSAQASGE